MDSYGTDGGLEASASSTPRARPAAAAMRRTNTAELTAATIRRAQGGDERALEEVLKAVRPRVVALAIRVVRDPDEAEDVVQDALTKLWRNLDRYEARSAFSTWLHRIVVNTALDHLRARRSGVVVARPRPRAGGDSGEGADERAPQTIEETTPEELLARAELGRVVRGAMAELTPAHREILAWRELDGESYQDIARLARCPVGTVMSRLHHARHRLAETLRDGAAELLPRAA